MLNREFVSAFRSHLFLRFTDKHLNMSQCNLHFLPLPRWRGGDHNLLCFSHWNLCYPLLLHHNAVFSYQNQHTSGQRIWKIQGVYDKTDESEHKHPCVKLFYDPPWVLALLMLTSEAGCSSVWCLSYECIFMTSIGGGFALYSAVSRLGGGLGQLFRPGIWRQSRSVLKETYCAFSPSFQWCVCSCAWS